MAASSAAEMASELSRRTAFALILYIFFFQKSHQSVQDVHDESILSPDGATNFQFGEAKAPRFIFRPICHGYVNYNSHCMSCHHNAGVAVICLGMPHPWS